MVNLEKANDSMKKNGKRRAILVIVQFVFNNSKIVFTPSFPKQLEAGHHDLLHLKKRTAKKSLQSSSFCNVELNFTASQILCNAEGGMFSNSVFQRDYVLEKETDQKAKEL